MIRLPRLSRKRPAEAVLPTPAIASSSSGPRNTLAGSGPSTSEAKRATFDDETFPGALRVHWSRFKKRLGNGSNVSESLLEITDTNTASESHHGRVHPESVTAAGKDDFNDEEEEVNEVVVDNTLAFELPGSKSVTQQSDHGGTPEKSRTDGTHGTTQVTDSDSLHEHGGIWLFIRFFTAVWYKLRAGFNRFFFTAFYDPASERQYKKETYFQMKPTAIWASILLIANWVLICILIPRSSMVTLDKVFYYGIAPWTVFPLPIMIIFDWPKDRPLLYQWYMSISIWVWPAYVLLLLQLCGYYTPDHHVINCGTKEFISVFYYTSAFHVISLFALAQERSFAAVSVLLNAGMLASVIHYKNTWTRHLLNYVLYMGFVLFCHYQKESAERRLFSMRDRLKVQYRATQKAQVREVRAADSKKRFSSYIFHEVRVPLNTALLAVQNMAAMGVFDRENVEYIALEGSLQMMSKVLNDVLDFNRMDSGRFESIFKPYAFHSVVKGMLVPLQITANARQLNLVTELDPKIDEAARMALYKAQGMSEEDAERRVKENPQDEEAGLVVGDEHRLRQVVTNLASNAAKFTPTGGKISVRTKLLTEGFGSVDDERINPPLPDTPDEVEETTKNPLEQFPQPGLTGDRLRMHDGPARMVPPGSIVIRIEVEDTGVGIKRKDMVDNRLFSPYVQTDLGRHQGGKGTGLGLALSKHIVRLSGGRLGVMSKRDKGSMFWVEVAVGVGQKVLDLRQASKTKDGIVVESFSPTNITAPPFESAMKEIMEHSGQIDLVPRMAHRLTDSTLGSSNTKGSTNATANGAPVSSGPPSPVIQKVAPGMGVRPTGIALPPPPIGWGDAIPLPTLISSGSTPTPTAPLPQPQLQIQKKSAALPPPIFDPPLSVLVVDDDGLTRKLMTRMLTRLGCTVETADNGKTAYDLAMRAPNPFNLEASATVTTPNSSRLPQTPYLQESDPRYDVIFLDNQMPVMSGVDAVRRLREMKRKDFVVGVTGNALKEDQQEYLEAGVDAVLTKPVAEASLRGCLHAADERRKQRLANGNASGEDSTPSGSR